MTQAVAFAVVMTVINLAFLCGSLAYCGRKFERLGLDSVFHKSLIDSLVRKNGMLQDEIGRLNARLNKKKMDDKRKKKGGKK